jgi:Uma2 family endonuclease
MSFRRRNALSQEQRQSFAQLCPEFVIEVRSETDRLPPLQEKMQLWIANGAELAWLIDPSRKVVEIYRPGQQPEIHENPTSVQGTGPIAGFELVMDRIWE